MKRFLLHLSSFLILNCVLASGLYAQGTDSLLVRGKRLLATGFNEANIEKIQEARTMFERATADKKRAALAHYYVALSDNRLGNIVGVTDEKKGLVHIDLAIQHLNEAVKINKKFAEGHALLSSVYGRKIGFKPMMGMILGPKADMTLKKAKDLAPNNPRIIYIEAMSDLHKPETWGGSTDRAIKGLERAAALFAKEKIKDPLQPDWGHDEAYAWLGIAYMRQEAYDKAETAFNKALEINPDFSWVKTTLIPTLKAQSNSK